MNGRDERARESLAPWRERLHEIIFEADTRAGKAFDVLLLLAIVLSVATVVLESVQVYREAHGALFRGVEWFFTLLFTLEYAVRIACVRRPARYVFSFFGVVDLLAILPTYLLLLGADAAPLLVVRVFRLLRVFRIFKLGRFLAEAGALLHALRESRQKITVFLTTVLVIVVVAGAVMHLVEGADNGFTSIPQSMYWAVVTMTTVGYGDIAPQTELGKLIAALIMVVGYSLIIVPTGILSAELAQADVRPVSTQACPTCSLEGHDPDARHCKHCGAAL